MKHEQTVPQMGLRKDVREAKFTGIGAVKREYGGNPTLDLLVAGTQTASKVLAKKKELDLEQMTLESDRTLNGYRQLLGEATSEEDFDRIAKEAEDDLSTRFNDRFFGSEFWEEHGDNILNAHREDVEKIREKKQFDFTKQSLNDVLGQNQNMLAYSEGKRGDTLLARGMDIIDKTDFLDDEEKNKYRDEYLKTGILNLALNDADEAYKMVDKFSLKQGDDVKKQIMQTRNLSEEAVKAQENKRLRDKEIAEYNQTFAYWQAKERGEIKPSEFFVLTAGKDDEMLWGDFDNRSETPLADAYKIVKRINNGEQLSAQDIRLAGNQFISAYRQKKLGLDEVGALHNQLILSQVGENGSQLLFDNDVDKLVDLVLLPDVEISGKKSLADDFMENKAKLAFDIYETYYSKKTALADEFVERGGEITPALEKRFRKLALKETREEMGLKENVSGDLSFSELKRVLKNAYVGFDERNVWRKFYEKAPYVEDKKALMRQIAMAEQKKELSYPQFDTLAELESSGLGVGERFYFKGRLAVKA